METTNYHIAKEIANQIGNRALFMIGAKNLAAGEKTLSFKIGRNSMGVNYVRITLTPLDLYKMEFMSIRGTSVKVKSEVDGIYNDMLNRMIEKHTGLYTSI